MRQFVIGDIHWGYRSLIQCLQRSKFNYDKDQLIVLWDISDWWPDTPLVIEELLKIKNLIHVEWNHDTWARQWFLFGSNPIIWTQQWGQATIDSYLLEPELLVKHRDFWDWMVKCYVDSKNRLFVHWGFRLGESAEFQDARYLTWDRDLWDNRYEDLDISPYNEVFVWHTTTWAQSEHPFNSNRVWFLDQWGGWEWRLTIMNVNTHNYWQSDVVKTLYPECRGR